MSLLSIFDPEPPSSDMGKGRYSKYSQFASSSGSVASRSAGKMKAARKVRNELAKDARALQALASIGDAPSTYRTGGLSLRSVGGKELNFKDVSITSFSAASLLTLLNGLVSGTGATQRVGRKITIKSIQVTGYVGITGDEINRFALVVDTQANATAPAITDIYTASSPSALREINNMPRFKVLWDSGPIGQVLTSDSEICTFDVYKRVNVGVQYNAGVVGDITDIQTNSLYFVHRNTGASVSSGRLDVRIRYDDN